MGLTAAAAVVLARTLGPTGYGIYSWAFAWVSALAAVAALGADRLLLREAAVTLERYDWGNLRMLLRTVLVGVSAAALVLCVLVAAALVFAGQGLGLRRMALLVALPIVPLAAVTVLAQGGLLGLGRTAIAVAAGGLTRQAAFLGLVGIGALVGGVTAVDAVSLQLAATALSCVAVLVLLRRAVVTRSAEVVAIRQPSPQWWRVSIPMGAATVLLMLDAQVGLLVLGARGSTTGAGLLAAALQCTAPFSLLLTAGALPLGGAVARLGAVGERARLQRGLRTATRSVAAVAAVLAAILFVVPGRVLALFGGGFSGAADVLRILALAHFINAICAFNGLVLIMSGQERAAMWAALCGLVLDACFCLILVPPFGPRGAASAFLISVTVRNGINSLSVRRRLGIDATVIGYMRRK